MAKTLLELLGGHDPLREVKVKPKYQIYCDMDGVLSDFRGRFEHYTGMNPRDYEDKYGRTPFWNVIDNEIGLVYWSKMDWTPGGKMLWNFIKPYNPQLLTSPSVADHSRLGKKMWVRENLNPAPKINFRRAKDKQDFANENSILIDDREDTIERWRNAGGIGIHHPENTSNIAPIINQLKELGYE
jgi:hypothetical protein